MAETNQPVGGACKTVPYKSNVGLLEVCWAKQNCECLLGKGSYGRVYKGKWKKNSEAVTIDVAVKAPRNDAEVAYEIKTFEKADGHENILKFYDKIEVDGPFVRYI